MRTVLMIFHYATLPIGYRRLDYKLYSRRRVMKIVALVVIGLLVATCWLAVVGISLTINSKLDHVKSSLDHH